MAGGLRGEVAPLQDVVPARGRGRAAVLRHERAHAARAHARARARLRAGGRARGRRRPRRADALVVQAAAVPRRVLAGRVDARRRADARAQLRLRPVAVRGADLVDAAAREAGHRHERLPVGTARRDERRRARRLADVRRPPRARRRVRYPDRHALPARDVRHDRGGARRAGAACRTRSATTSRSSTRPARC